MINFNWNKKFRITMFLGISLISGMSDAQEQKNWECIQKCQFEQTLQQSVTGSKQEFQGNMDADSAGACGGSRQTAVSRCEETMKGTATSGYCNVRFGSPGVATYILQCGIKSFGDWSLEASGSSEADAQASLLKACHERKGTLVLESLSCGIAPTWQESLPPQDFKFTTLFKTTKTLTASEESSASRTTTTAEDFQLTLERSGDKLFLSGAALKSEVDQKGSGCIYIEHEDKPYSTPSYETRRSQALSVCLLSRMRVSFGSYTLNFSGNNYKTGHWLIQLQTNNALEGQNIRGWQQE